MRTVGYMADNTQSEAKLRVSKRWVPVTQRAVDSYRLTPTMPRGRMAVGDVHVNDLWFEVPLGDGWLAAYRLSLRDGISTFSELRIFPAEPVARDAGQWSGEFLGRDARPPAKRLTSRLVRRASPERHKRALEACLQNARSQGVPQQVLGLVEIPRRGVGRLGARPERARFYAVFALRFDALENGDSQGSTRQKLAAQYQVPETTIISYIRSARKLGFLDPTKPGRRGGSATDSAREMANVDPLLATISRKRRSR